MDRMSPIAMFADSERGSSSKRVNWRPTSRRASVPSRSARSRRRGSARGSPGGARRAYAHRRRRTDDYVLRALPGPAGMTPEARFEELLQTARDDESILGVILYGSRAAGLFVREDSDWDVWLIVRVGAFANYEER